MRGDRNQIELREMFCRGVGQRLYPTVTEFVIVTLGRQLEPSRTRTVDVEGRPVSFCAVDWRTVAALGSHPLAAELHLHLLWKERYGVTLAPQKPAEPLAPIIPAGGQA